MLMQPMVAPSPTHLRRCSSRSLTQMRMLARHRLEPHNNPSASPLLRVPQQVGGTLTWTVDGTYNRGTYDFTLLPLACTLKYL